MRCPVCSKRVHTDKLNSIASLYPFDGAMVFGEGSASGFVKTLSAFVSRIPDFYQWACDDCIDSQMAILANPKAQNYTPLENHPYLAYYDQHDQCRRCGQDFTFSKEEQRFWYEELHFYVDSVPRECKTCRKEIRAEKNLNNELSELLHDGEPQEKEKLLRIADIYRELGKEGKVKYYLARAMKKS